MTGTSYFFWSCKSNLSCLELHVWMPNVSYVQHLLGLITCQNNGGALWLLFHLFVVFETAWAIQICGNGAISQQLVLCVFLSSRLSKGWAQLDYRLCRYVLKGPQFTYRFIILCLWIGIADYGGSAKNTDKSWNRLHCPGCAVNPVGSIQQLMHVY